MKQQRVYWTWQPALVIGICALFILGGATIDFNPFPLLQIGPAPADGIAPSASATPAVIALGQPTDVTVTIQLTDPLLIPESVNLQRIDASGRVLTILGTLNDRGMNGDGLAGDQVFTLRHTFTETTVTPILLRVSWALRGSLVRVVSNILSIEVR